MTARLPPCVQVTARQASAAIATTGAVGDGGSQEWLVLDTMDAMAGLERAFPHFHQMFTMLPLTSPIAPIIKGAGIGLDSIRAAASNQLQN